MKENIKTRGLYFKPTPETTGIISPRQTREDQDLTDENLSGQSLSLCSFKNSNLSRAKLNKADLTRANFQHTNLSGADLSNALFFHTKLQGAQFDGTTIFSKFEPNHHLTSYKNSTHTNALFFDSVDDITTTLNRLATENQNPHPTLQAMVAHSLINQLVAAPADSSVIEKLDTHKAHAFFAGYDWATHYPSLVRGLVQGAITNHLSDAKMKLCAYFLILMPKLTRKETDLLDAFLTAERKGKLNQAITEDPALKGMLGLKKLRENNCAFTQISNTRRHLFHTERNPNETKHSKALFRLFKDSSSLNLNNETTSPALSPKGPNSP